VDEKTMNVPEWIEAYARAWRERDAVAAAGLFTERAVYRSHPFREPHVGTSAIRDYWSRATERQRDLDLRFGTPVVAGNRAAVEWWAQMRSDGADVTMPGTLYLRVRTRRALRGAARGVALRGRPSPAS
jgi:ketosteroid isomerase-like protein